MILKDVAIVKGGKRLPKTDELVSYRTEHPYIRIRDMYQSYPLELNSHFEYITDETHKKIKKYVVNQGDVIIAVVGNTIGLVSLIGESLDGANLTENCNKLVDLNNYDNKFLYYFLTSKQGQDEIQKGIVGSSQPKLPIYNVEKFEIPDVLIDTQIKIVSVLESIDKKIKINELINRNLLDQCRALYEDLISNYELNAKLSDLISIIETGSRPKGGAQESGVPSIGAEKIESFGVYDYSGEKFVSEEFFKKLKRGHVLSGDVLLYKDGAYTGKTSMALNDFPHAKCAINEHVYKLNTNNNLFQFFLYFTLDNKKNRDYIYTLASSKAAQPGLNQTELLSVEIAMPDATTLIEFEKNVSQMMNMIALNAKENRKLTILRDSLLPKLMSGELDVSD